jgi:exosortase family protein XrtF
MDFFKKPLPRFLITALILYLAWFCIYNLWLHPQQVIDLWIVKNTMDVSMFFLEGLGYPVFTNRVRQMGIDGTPGLFIGDECNGIPLFALFAIFIASFPGPAIKKIFFIPAGIVLIHLANIMRVTLLAVIQKNAPEWTQFNHTYTFTIIMYLFIFGLWMLWVKKFSGISISKKQPV